MKYRILAMLAALLSLAGPAIAAAPIRVMILDGQSGGAYHNWRLTTAALKKELEEAGRFSVTVVTAPQSDGDFSGFDPQFGKYQVVVSNYDAPDWPAPLRAQFDEFVRRGGGFVSVHAADNAFPGWPAYNQMEGIGGWRHRETPAGPMWHIDGGRLVADPAPGPAGSHGNRVPFIITARLPGHPILRGLPPQWMHTADEMYAHMRGPGNMTVLASAWSDPANKGSGHDEPMLMVLRYGKGRIFHTTLGHDTIALSCIGFITTFRRGVEWAATGKVTQPVPRTFPTADTVSYRADIAALDPAVAAGIETR
jgi:uncharacterized protein